MERQFTNMRDLTRVYAEAMNLLRPETENLHQRVAYIAYNIAKEMGFEGKDLEELLFTSFLYDVGIVLMPEKKEDEERYYFKDLAGSGLGILGDVKILRYATNVLRVADPESEVDFADNKYKSFAEIIDLADRIAFMLDTKDAALNQVEEISYSVQDMAGDIIGDDVVEAYLRFSEKEYVTWEADYTGSAGSISMDVEVNLTCKEAAEVNQISVVTVDTKGNVTDCNSFYPPSGSSTNYNAKISLYGMAKTTPGDACIFANPVK